MNVDERLPRGVRARLEARIAPRPWPPSARTRAGTAVIRTIERLRDDAHVAAARADWIVLAPDDLEHELKSSLVDAEVVVSGACEWTALPEALRQEAGGHATIVRLEVLGPDADWTTLLPPVARDVPAAGGRGQLLPVRAHLDVPGFGTVTTLHVWSIAHDEPVLQEDVSGVLDLSVAPRLA